MSIYGIFQRKMLAWLALFAFGCGHAAGQEAEPVSAPNAAVVGSSTSVADANTTPDASDEKLLKFSFRYAPWKDVLDWFATEAGYSLSLEAPPSGTFNYTDTRLYTPAESIDLLNSVLLVKGYTLVRRERMLILVNLEDGVPPNLVSNVTPDELDERGEFELLSCTFQLERMTPTEADEEINKLIGPQGNLIVLPKARQVVVTETAGKLRMIRDMINAVEVPEEVGSAAITQLELQHITPDEALLVIRQIMGIEEEAFSTEDDSLKLSVDALGTRLIAKATPNALAEVRDVLRLIDVPLEGAVESSGVSAAPQLMVYPISNADSDAVLQVLQTLLAGLPDVRLSIDPQTNNLIALARPPQHGTIKATLEQLQSQFDELEVIQLNYLDPATAKLAVQSLFGIDPDSEEPQTQGPRVDVNVTTRQLLVRGSRAEIERIKTLLEKMGENGEAALSQKGNVRMIPMSGASAQALLGRMLDVWPTIRGNRIRTVTPSAAVSTMRESGRRGRSSGEQDTDEPVTPRAGGLQRSIQPGAGPINEHRPSSDWPTGIGRAPSRDASGDRGVTYVAQAPQAVPASPSASDFPGRLPEIVVAPGPGGLLIASEDLEALDAFEELAIALSDPALFPDNDYTVFYLKYAKAEAAAKLLNDLISGEGGAAADSLASAAFGNLLDAAASVLDTSGPLQIIPDGRINALIVRGQAADVELIRQLLTIIDQEHSPEDVQTQAPPRLIPVFNSSAADVAEVVKEIYAKRIHGSNARGNNNNRQDMEQLIAAMRSGRGGGPGGGGRGGGGSGQPQVEPDLTVGVDNRSNSLIVSAPEPLFLEIKALVAQLDEVAISSNEVTRVVAVTKANPDTIQRALGSLFGAQVSSTNASSSNNNVNNVRQPPRQDRENQAAQEAIRRRLEFFNALRRGGFDGDRGGSDGGRFGGRGRGGGGGDGRRPGGREGGREGGGRGGR